MYSYLIIIHYAFQKIYYKVYPFTAGDSINLDAHVSPIISNKEKKTIISGLIQEYFIKTSADI